MLSRLETINRNLWRLTPEQRLAFGLWYSKAWSPSNITLGPPSIIRDTGNLIAYLPFHTFQHLSPAQVTRSLSPDSEAVAAVRVHPTMLACNLSPKRMPEMITVSRSTNLRSGRAAAVVLLSSAVEGE